MPDSSEHRDRNLAEMHGVPEGRVMDFFTGAALALRSVVALSDPVDLKPPPDVPRELLLAARHALDLFDQVVHALETADQSNLKPHEHDIYSAIVARFVDCWRAEHVARGNATLEDLISTPAEQLGLSPHPETVPSCPACGALSSRAMHSVRNKAMQLEYLLSQAASATYVPCSLPDATTIGLALSVCRDLCAELRG